MQEIIPYFDPLTFIDRAPLARSTKRQYRRTLENYLAQGYDLTNPEQLSFYADTLCLSSKMFLRASLTLWVKEMAHKTKAQATPHNIDAIQATLYRLEILPESIVIPKHDGEKAHIWLSPTETRKLIAATGGTDIVAMRDRLVICGLVGTGLRREELANLLFTHMLMQGDRAVLSFAGKGNKTRIVPINSKIADMVNDWSAMLGGTGYVVRSLGRDKTPKDSISSQAIHNIVAKYGAAIGKPELEPHDLRRTYAQIGLDNGVSIQQLSILLGHSSIETTQKYLNIKLDLDVTVSDFVPM